MPIEYTQVACILIMLLLILMNGIYSNRSNPKMLCSVTSHYRKKERKEQRVFLNLSVLRLMKVLLYLSLVKVH